VRGIVGAAVGGDGRGADARPEAPPPFDGRGILEDTASAAAAAARSFAEFAEVSLERRRAIIEAMRRAALASAERLARMAVEETGLGRVEDKVRKNTLVATRTPGLEDLEPVAFSGDHGLTIVERAPYGVIGSITPCTNPTETVINNGISMVAGGNAVVFNPHPSARVVTLTTIDILNRAIAEAGGPRALLFSVSAPSIATAQELMSHAGVRLLVVTGGPAVVRAAMRSGKKVIAAGPGNPPAVIDESADIPKAARDIIAGASLDNNIVCIAEKEIIAVRRIANDLRAALVDAGAVEVRGQAIERLTRLLVVKDEGPGRSSELERRFIGKDAPVILEAAGLSCPPGARIAFFETDRSHPLFWTEQMMPIIPMVTVETAAEAIALAREVEGGCGHTAVMHSRNIANLSRMARTMNVSIFVKNGPSFAGLGFGGEGFTSFTIASPTGEGLTSARTFTRERRCTLVDYFRIV
jgi:acyl-CoA reductase-like NAD-dependent aldehyde dehydrogenase